MKSPDQPIVSHSDPEQTGAWLPTPLPGDGSTGVQTPEEIDASRRRSGGTHDDPLPPSTPRYRFNAFIARGGMGEVYRGEDLLLKRTVALKVLRRQLGMARDEFRAEAQLVAGLSHPGIVAIHDLGELPDDRVFFAMKLVEGKTLNEVIGENIPGVSKLPRLLTYFEQICQTVAYAHSHMPPLLHRDLKPHNVMIGAFGEVQVMDWGIAKFVRDPAQASPTLQSPGNGKPEALARDTLADPSPRAATPQAETAHGMAKGTPAYMAPEQARGDGKQIGPATDVFGLGGILCQMLTGEPTFVGRNAFDNAYAGDLAESFARLDRCGADPELMALTKRSLAPRMDDRYQNAGELAEAVTAYRNGVEERLKQAEVERAQAETEALEKRKRRKVQLALAASVLVLLLGGGIAGWWYDHETSRRRLEDELRGQAERERVRRDSQSLETALKQTEDALGNDDTPRAEILFVEAERRMAAGEHEAERALFERCKKDLAMLKQLDRIDDFGWTVAKNDTPDVQREADQFRGAFNGFGIDVDATEPSEASRRISESLIAPRLLTALDTWLVLEPSPKLAAILTAADPNSYREAVRRLIQARAFLLLQAIADRPEATQQPARFMAVIVQLSVFSMAEQERHLLALQLRHPSNFKVLMELAKLYVAEQKERLQKGIIWYRAALAVRPRNVAAWYNLGLALYLGKDVDGAIRAYEQAIFLDPEFAPAHNNLGNALHSKGEMEAAVRELKEAVRLNPNFATHHNDLGAVLSDVGDPNGAVDEFNKAIVLDPRFAKPHNGLGVILFGKNDVAGAIREFEEALRLNRDFAQSPKNLERNLAEQHSNLGLCHIENKNLDVAINEFNEAIRLDPEGALAHNGLGIALAQKNDLDGAIREWREAICLDPKLAQAHCNLGKALAPNDLDGAIKEFEEAIRLAPKFPEPHDSLGLILYGKKELDRALAEFETAVRLGPRLGIARAHLGMVLLDMGRFLEAKNEFAAAKNLLSPDHPLQNLIPTTIAKIDELVSVEKRLAIVLANSSKPENAAEALRFAELCQEAFKRLYLTSYRFYTEAFANNPKLADDMLRQPRYNAACAAALAADGKGIDPPQVSERPELRRQARDWLTADVAAWTKVLDSAPERNRAGVHGTMLHWLSDSDLASIRDPEKLKELHSDEQRAMEKLWNDVRALRDRTREQLPPPKSN